MGFPKLSIMLSRPALDYRSTTAATLGLCLITINLTGCINLSGDKSETASQATQTSKAAPEKAVPPQATKAKPTAPKAAMAPSAAFQQALDKADGAKSIGATAASKDDWELAISRWEQAIALLKKIPKQDPNYKKANTKIAEFQSGLAKAKEGAQGPKIAARTVPEFNSDGPSNSSSGGGSRGNLIVATIKSRDGGTPVIDVMLNGQMTEMMVDTGASGTMITPQQAASAGIREEGRIPIMTPAGRSTAGIGQAQSISVNGRTIRNVPVAIGPTPLLGQDFFGDCDVTFKQNVVEFANCASM